MPALQWCAILAYRIRAFVNHATGASAIVHFFWLRVKRFQNMLAMHYKYVPLGDRQRVEGAIDQVLALIAPSYFAESTLAMPITRDLSAGKRTVLQLWGGLVK